MDGYECCTGSAVESKSIVLLLYTRVMDISLPSSRVFVSSAHKVDYKGGYDTLA